jgi:hypothetical protein
MELGLLRVEICQPTFTFFDVVHCSLLYSRANPTLVLYEDGTLSIHVVPRSSLVVVQARLARGQSRASRTPGRRLLPVRIYCMANPARQPIGIAKDKRKQAFNGIDRKTRHLVKTLGKMAYCGMRSGSDI